MKERQRWQPEEDALLRAYVRQYGPKEWNLIPQRMGCPLQRDPKSCLERWKNYLKPGIKKGSLTPDEQELVISLQAKYGNKWKKIAAEVPGRTAKRLGKWWEVFKEKQLKQIQSSHAGASSPDVSAHGKYDHILDTFAEKYVQNTVFAGNLPIHHETPSVPSLSPVRIPEAASSSGVGLPAWMNANVNVNVNVNGTPSSSLTSSSSNPSPGVSFTLSSSEPAVLNPAHLDPPRLFVLAQELDEGRKIWVRYNREAAWRLSRLEQQLQSEKARRLVETKAEVEEKVRQLREEETAFVSRLEGECREELNALRRDAEAKEAKLMEAWCKSHVKLASLLHQAGAHTAPCRHGPPAF